MTRSAPNSIATIDQFIAQVGSVKTASEKAADSPLSEAGSIGGETTHPVKKVDDRLEKAKEGERSAENSKDVKKDQGAPSVESTKSAASIFKVANAFAKKAEGGAVSTPGSAEDDHISSTLKVAPTGEDSANETNSAKAGKEDKEQGGLGGTKHPASTENDSLDGHKYASDTPLEKLAMDMRNIGNNLLSSIHAVYQGNGVQPPQQQKQAAYQPQHNKQAADPQLAYFAGHELAGLISGTFDKQAADQMVHNTLTGVIKQASDDADMFVQYAHHYLTKQAEGEEGGEPPMPEAGGGGEDPMAAMAGGAGGGGEGGGGEEEMMAALGGGAGGDPAGGGGDPSGGGGGGDQEAQQLAQILEQLGVTPEQLEQALAAQGGGGGGGMGGDPSGGMGGGADPMAAMGGGGAGAPPGGGMPGMETQANYGGGKRNAGNTKIAAADIANHIREIVSRSRPRR